VYAASSRFLKAITTSGKRKTVVDVYMNGAQIDSDIPVIGGRITVDRNSRTRRSGSITLGDPSFFPKFDDNTFTPYGVEIGIRHGIVYPDGTEELIPQGIFLINDIEADEAEGLIPTIEFFDRAHRVFETSTHVTDGGPNMVGDQTFSGSRVHDALHAVIDYPSPNWPNANQLWSLNIDTSLSNPTIPGGQFEGDTDRWKLAQDLAAMIGGEIYFDVFGNATCIPIPGITVQELPPDWEVFAGEGGVMVSAAQRVTREETFNSVVMLGSTPSGTERQARAIVYDLNPASKTYYYGPFGKKTLRLSDQRLTTDEACYTAANGVLKNSLGIAKTVTFKATSNPALDGGDIVKITYPDGLEELHLLDSFDIDFKSGVMGASTRSIQLAVA
jgi:hypothetical protein